MYGQAATSAPVMHPPLTTTYGPHKKPGGSGSVARSTVILMSTLRCLADPPDPRQEDQAQCHSSHHDQQ